MNEKTAISRYEAAKTKNERSSQQTEKQAALDLTYSECKIRNALEAITLKSQALLSRNLHLHGSVAVYIERS